jgi:hypothetical protein
MVGWNDKSPATEHREILAQKIHTSSTLFVEVLVALMALNENRWF